MSNTIKLGIIGTGRQVQGEFLPYLKKRMEERQDIEIAWGAGCLCSPHEMANCPLKAYGIPNDEGHSNDWKRLFDEKPVDAVLVSGPNSLHVAPIRIAIDKNIHVATDKPTTVYSSECEELVRAADGKGIVFVTMSQRRYEEVYRTAADIIRRGDFGEPILIDYLIAHQDFERGRSPVPWWKIRSLSGGGVLMHSGYHGIDTVFWLLRQYGADDCSVLPKSVSCRYVLDMEAAVPEYERTEIAAECRIGMSNGSMFSVVTLCHTCKGSLDENIKIFGSDGVIRIMRDRPVASRVPAELSFQENSGRFMRYETSHWEARRDAPLDDFINAILKHKAGQAWSVLSPARDSIATIRTIEAAYKSAQTGGAEVFL